MANNQKIVITFPAPGGALRGHCVDQKARLRWRVRPNGLTGHDRVMWLGDWILDPPDRIIDSGGVVYKLPELRA